MSACGLHKKPYHLIYNHQCLTNSLNMQRIGQFYSFCILYILIAINMPYHGVSTMQGRIVNGTQTNAGEFPFMVSLRYAKGGRHSCGASLLNRAWVLTAGHCVHRASASQFNIQYGSLILDKNSTKIMNVSKIFVHEGYFPSNKFIHDIALIKLTKPIEFDDKAHAVRLPEMQQFTEAHAPAMLIGWGLNATGGKIQSHLQKVNLEIFSDEECSSRHELQLHDTNICAGVPDGGKGQCSGDSGGPLMVNGTQVGIVSWSRKPCTVPPYPGVFTEVSAYIDWILKTIGRDALENDADKESDESQEQITSGNLIIVTRKNPLSKNSNKM